MIEFQGFPTLDLDHGFLRSWWWEPMVATLAFAVFLNIYWYQERIRGLSANNSFGETCYFELGPLFSSGLAYWAGIYLWKTIVPPAADHIPDGIPTNPSEVVYLLAEIVTGIVLYDSILFFVHWSMHEVPLLRSWHHRHHDRPEGTLEARDTLRHSIADGTLQVLINILVQRHTPWGMVKSRLARAIHNVLVVWMLTESHTCSPEPYIWRRWCVGIREHRLHHFASMEHDHYGKYHRHQQFFGYLDDLRAMYRARSKQQRVLQ